MLFPDWLRYEMREKWERLGERFSALRNWINRQNPKIILGVTVGCVVLLLVTVISLGLSRRAPRIEKYDKGWFYDLNTGELFLAKSGSIPPIEAPSGPLANGRPAGVRAHVFTYVYEPNESERFIGFLETTDPNAQDQAVEGADAAEPAKPSTGNAESGGQERWIRRVEDEQWVLRNSREGVAIVGEVYRPNENGELPSYCRPR
jgi:hypothetical protein